VCGVIGAAAVAEIGRRGGGGRVGPSTKPIAVITGYASVERVAEALLTTAVVTV
jgi:hypothetical protein